MSPGKNIFHNSREIFVDFLKFEFHERFCKIENNQRKSEKQWKKYLKNSKDIIGRNFKKLSKISSVEINFSSDETVEN